MATPFRLLVHGEVGQGHDHFAEFVLGRLGKEWSRWRTIDVAWPAPSAALGWRLAMLLGALGRGLGVDLGAPAGDPSTAAGARAWGSELADLVAAIDAARQPLLVRHVVRWIGAGAGGYAALVDAYVQTIWAAVAARSGAQAVVSLDLRRIERTGGPWRRAWWSARRDLAVVRAAERVLSAHRLPHGVCLALPELTSVTEADLDAWLRREHRVAPHAARAEASQLVASTRGGRFDLVAARLQAAYPDRHRDHEDHKNPGNHWRKR